MASLGAFALARDAAAGSLTRSALGALIGAAAAWQVVRNLQGRLADKSLGNKDALPADVESQSMLAGGEPVHSIINVDTTSPLNGYALAGLLF